MTLKHEVTTDFIVEAIETFFDFRVENNPDWVSDARLSLKDELLDFVSDCGVGDHTPSYIVDNFLINGQFVTRSDDGSLESDEAWEAVTDYAIVYNDEYACLQF